MAKIASIIVGTLAAIIFISMFIVRIVRGYYEEYN